LSASVPLRPQSRSGSTKRSNYWKTASLSAGGFEQGKKDAQTSGDYISYDMEHAPFDVAALAEYMINQVLATGVHGIMLPHADTPGAVRAFVEAMRLPIHKQGVDKGIGEGRRGIHGVAMASKIWGVTSEEYLQKADLWPLNPNGELLLGLKMEDKYSVANAEEILKVPGISFGELGPGDLILSLGLPRGNDGPIPPQLQQAHDKVFGLMKKNKILYHDSSRFGSVTELIQSGAMILFATDAEMEAGRNYTKRPRPW
jgi:4-hydroxy-2-oxoheptanedioate aldolase